MNKLIIAVLIIAITAAIAYFLLKPKPQPSVEEESYVLSDSVNDLIIQELEKVSVDQSAFNAEVENELANTLSSFYYQ